MHRDWTLQLPPLLACGVLPKLPPLADLRAAAEASLHPRNAISSTTTKDAQPLFDSQQLYHAILRCVHSQPDVPPCARSPAALLITSLAMEEYVRAHSTKAKLAATQRALFAQTTTAAEADGASTAAVTPQQFADTGDEANTADGADGSNGDAAADDDGDSDGLVSFFRSNRPPDEVAEQLRLVLREPEHQRIPLLHIVTSHDAKALAGMLRAALRAVQTGDVERADGNGPKTIGGVFFREFKRLKAAATLRVERQILPPLPPMRSYQRDVVGLVLSSWGLPLTPEVLQMGQEGAATGADGGAAAAAAAAAAATAAGADTPAPATALAARFQGLAGGWRGNWLVCSPTNSGKTRMFIEVARGLVDHQQLQRRGALVVVLVPNVILTSQHAAYFERAGLPNTRVTAHSSDNQLTRRVWREAVQWAALSGISTVLVCTAESLVNLLRSGAASLTHIDLLILDEAHHCKDEHPYANVVRGYDSRAPDMPRILGVSASPASEQTEAALCLRMSSLLTRLGAQLHVVDDDDPTVAATVPEPRALQQEVAMRAVDAELMAALQAFAVNAAVELADALELAAARGSEATREKLALLVDLDAAIRQSITESSGPPAAGGGGRQSGQPQATKLDPLGQWLSSGMKFAARYRCPLLELHCRLMDVLRKAIELIEDAGFEGALPYLARKAATLCKEEHTLMGPLEGAAGTAAAVAAAGCYATPLPPCPLDTPYRPMLLAAAAASATTIAGVDEEGGGGGLGEEPRGLAALRAVAAQLPSGQEVAARGDAAVAAAVPPGNSCGDVELRVSKLLRDLLSGDGEVELLSAPEAAGLVQDCFASGLIQEDRTFPKFWALLTYLLRYREQEDFHGIIFVKTRQAVFHIADLIRRTAQLQFLEVLELIGHNSASGKRSTLTQEEDRHGRGMSDTQQQQVVRLFKSPGRKVLVATSAAEEGLDVPSCEFVVRYNAAATGIQLLQSRGRARRKVAEFFAILQAGTQDPQLHLKSQREEANMRAFNQLHKQTKGAWLQQVGQA